MARNTWTALYNDTAAGLSTVGLTLATFTTAAPVFGDIVFPIGYFSTKRLMHLRCRGTYGSTGAPTYTFRLQQTAGTVGTIVTSAAVTAGTTQTNMPWELDIQIVCRLDGSSGALFAMGDGNLGLTTTTSSNFYLPAAGTAPANLTTNTDLQQTWQLQVACGTSNASNTVTGQILELKHIN